MNRFEQRARITLVNFALEQLEKPYEHGAHGPDSFDCAGLIWYIYDKILNIDIYKDGEGKSTTGQIMTSKYGTIKIYNEELDILKTNDFKLGDILFFHRQARKYDKPTKKNKYPGHVGLYIGDKTFIHATKDSQKVITSEVNDPEWNKILIAKKDMFINKK